MEWRSYYATLTMFLRMVSLKPELEKLMVRGVTEMLDNFHFDIGQQASQALTKQASKELENIAKVQQQALEQTEREEEDDEDAADEVLFATESQRKLVLSEDKGEEEDEEEEGAMQVDEEEEEEESDEEEEDEEEEEVPVAADPKVLQAQKIQDVLVNSILPTLHHYMKSGDKFEIHKVHVAVAAVQVCKMLPHTVRQAALPRIIIPLCNRLKSRMQSMRDGARTSLVRCMSVLGPGYFGYVLGQLQFALRRGFEAHVLGFTVHAILGELLRPGSDESAAVCVGDLDYCMDSLVEVFCEDVFGEVAKEKNVQAIAQKGKEMAGTKSFDSFEMIGKVIGFPETINKVIDPLCEALDASERIALVKRIREALTRFGSGLTQNPTFAEKLALDYIVEMIAQYAKGFGPEQAQDDSDTTKTLVDITMKRESQVMTNIERHGHVLVDFALSLTMSGLKRKEWDLEFIPELDKMFGMFVLLLKHATADSTRTLVLKCAERIVQTKLDIPCLKLELPLFASQVLQLLEQAGGDLGEVVKAAFRFLATVSRDLPDFKFGEQQLKVMLQLAAVNMEDPERQSVCFGIVKGVIMHKVVIAEIYDAMDEVAELSIRAGFDHSRQMCRELFVHFLAHYPMAPKRLHRHLEFVLKHLEYVHVTGRLSALKLVNQIVAQFPAVLVREQCQLFLLPLVLRLINDDEPDCCKAAASAIQAMLGRLEHAKLAEIVQLCVSWYQGSKEQLKGAAAQVLGLLCELGDKKVPTTLLKSALEPILGFLVDQPDPTTDSRPEEDRVSWRVVYSSLVAAEKILQALPQVVSPLYEKGKLWAGLTTLLLHSHSWVRSAACRLFGLHMSLLGSPEQVWTQHKSVWLADKTVLKLVANKLCNQLTSDLLDEQLGEQIAKNLVFIAATYLAAPVGQQEEEDGTAADGGAEVAATPAGWLLRRLSFLARTSGLIKRQSVFRCMAALCIKLDLSVITANLPRIVSPLFRITTQREVGYEASQLESLAHEVLALVEKTVGTNTFTTAYNGVRAHMDENKRKRKAESALEAIVNPAKFAQKKVAKGALKKRQRSKSGDDSKMSRQKR
eukprot:TRINITY_DN8976_c0_g1_i1.p1 TRINITY_DN8976_c0_g1~~TRINITY_DN8976_c0_g1_i1.p1  ORF type:complete len:1076 (+),score=435.82 TRINITY_DN8976_c0_g1_i1:162-3389(+)